MRSNTYTFLFALAICVVSSFSLSLISQLLKPMQLLNQELDVKKNILKAVKLIEPLPNKATQDDIVSVYKNKIEELVIDNKGDVIQGITLSDIKADDDRYPLFIYKEEGKIISYCYPIKGKGLWSTLYGYLALEPDAITVRGITFYKHGETPGLGAEIEKDWFQDNFKGKKVWSEDKKKLVSVSVVKGKVQDKYKGDDAMHYVDGISGATMTSKGVTELMKRGLDMYEAYFGKIRKTTS